MPVPHGDRRERPEIEGEDMFLPRSPLAPVSSRSPGAVAERGRDA